MKTASNPAGRAPRERAALIRLSLWCFVLSLVGLVPVAGVPFAVATIWAGGRARRIGTDWNPAARYLTAARRIAPLGFLTTALALVVAWAIVPALRPELTYCSPGGG